MWPRTVRDGVEPLEAAQSTDRLAASPAEAAGGVGGGEGWRGGGGFSAMRSRRGGQSSTYAAGLAISQFWNVWEPGSVAAHSNGGGLHYAALRRLTIIQANGDASSDAAVARNPRRFCVRTGPGTEAVQSLLDDAPISSISHHHAKAEHAATFRLIAAANKARDVAGSCL